MRNDLVTDEAADILRGAEARAEAAAVEWEHAYPTCRRTPTMSAQPPTLRVRRVCRIALSPYGDSAPVGCARCACGGTASVAGRLRQAGGARRLYGATQICLWRWLWNRGNRKTAVVNAARQPLVDFEREEQDRVAPQRRNAISERKTHEAQIL